MRKDSWFQWLSCQLTLTWGQWIFSHLLNLDWSIQISRAPAVCKVWKTKLLLLIWKAFQSKEEWRFPFWNIFFVLEIFTLLYYANEESDDVIDGSTVTVQYSKKNISRTIKAVFVKLGTRNVHHKRYKMTSFVPLPWQQLCHWSCFNYN